MGYVIKDLKGLRMGRFLTQKELAEKASLSKPTIIAAEAGAEVERDTVFKLAAALEMLPADLAAFHPPEGE